MRFWKMAATLATDLAAALLVAGNAALIVGIFIFLRLALA